MSQSPTTDEQEANGHGEPTGPDREIWLNNLRVRMLKGVVTPAAAAKIPLRVWREAGVPESILNDCGLTGLTGMENLPPRCSIEEFRKMLLDQLGIKRDRGDIYRDFDKQDGFAKSARNPKSNLVETLAGLNIYREKFGDRRGAEDSVESSEGAKSASELDREFKETRNEDAKIDLENKRRLSDAKWVYRSVMMETAASLGVVVKSVARDILEKQEKRPELFDRFQRALDERFAELLAQAKRENETLKAEEQRKVDVR